MSQTYSQAIAVNPENRSAFCADAKEPRPNTEPDVTLDLGAAKCPLLGLKSMKALGSLETGQTIEIATAGPSAAKALRRVAWMTGSKLLALRQEEGKYKHLLRKV